MKLTNQVFDLTIQRDVLWFEAWVDTNPLGLPIPALGIVPLSTVSPKPEPQRVTEWPSSLISGSGHPMLLNSDSTNAS